MTFNGEEGGAESSQPREGIELIAGLVTYRLATGTRDVTIDGQIYTAYPIAREETGIAASIQERELIIAIPLKHALPQRYLNRGVPPKRVDVKLWRKQPGAEEIVFRGAVTSMAIEGEVAKFRCPSTVTELLQRQLPVITIGRQCPHILYDANCRADRGFFDVTGATITSINGRTVKVSTMDAQANDWATYGEIVHTATGERMTIESHVGLTLTLQLPIVGLAVGDAVTVYAGCNHSIQTCHSKFSNRANFGGFPQLEDSRLFAGLFSGIKAGI